MGAITESEYVFLKMGLDHLREKHPDQKEINILEIGFGTGLNAWLTALAVEDTDVKVKFTSIEKFPLEAGVVDQLNYKHKKESAEAKRIFEQVHAASWETENKITEHFDLTKLKTDLFDFNPVPESHDLIYFDAFAPSKQPEMWSQAVLKKMFDLLKSNGVFVTYCGAKDNSKETSKR